MPAFPGGVHRGTVVPLDRRNVDTDAIFPKQYGRSTAKSGYGPVLFDNWRYLDPGDLGSDHAMRRPDPDFVLNQPALRGASVMESERLRSNFSSRLVEDRSATSSSLLSIPCVISPMPGSMFQPVMLATTGVVSRL